MDFGSPSSGSRSDGPNEQQVMSQVQGEIQLAMLQEFYTVSPMACLGYGMCFTDLHYNSAARCKCRQSETSVLRSA